RADQLEQLRADAVQCQKCRLCEERTHVVFGEGNPNAGIMFIGEAPGADEDRQARPFVGRAGKLLNQMMEEVGLKREDVFIGNMLKCRPPGNRDPQPDELDTCEPWLLSQIDLIQPSIIITLGRFAAQRLTGESTGIMKMRGSFYRYHDTKLMPLLHPAAVLRNMNHYKDTVDDLRRALGAVKQQH
ncbi:MAG: uracil-DNA glycosylase, partial [Candidatus Sumerlaeota bacterium]